MSSTSMPLIRPLALPVEHGGALRLTYTLIALVLGVCAPLGAFALRYIFMAAVRIAP